MATQKTSYMQSTQNSQRKVHFNNGKTFYVDITSQNGCHLYQSLALPKSTKDAHHNIPPPSSLTLFYRSNAYLARQDVNHGKLHSKGNSDFKQLNQPHSNQNAETHRNFKFNKKCTNSISLENHNELTKSSTKKHKIFDNKIYQSNGSSCNNLKKIKAEKYFYDSNQKDNLYQSNQNTAPSKNLCFSRSNESYTAQQIPSYQKKAISSMNFYDINPKIISQSQPISRHQTYLSFDSRKALDSSKEKLKYITQVQSKHFIAIQQSKTSLKQFQQNRQNLERQGSSNCKQSKNVTKNMRISLIDQKQSHVKGNMQNFCEQSTLKITQRVQRKIETNNNVSISNIEQDNSFSRYYDTDDELLPILNRISYKNVEISNKSYEKADQAVIHNIFMDFQKAPSPTLLHKRQSRQIVHYDCTMNKPKCEKSDSINNTINSSKPIYITIMSKIPWFLILATIIMLIMQVLG